MVEDDWAVEYAEVKARSAVPTPEDSRNVSPIISIEQPGTKRVESKFIETDNALLLRQNPDLIRRFAMAVTEHAEKWIPKSPIVSSMHALRKEASLRVEKAKS